jgi:hypothetical protein
MKSPLPASCQPSAKYVASTTLTAYPSTEIKVASRTLAASRIPHPLDGG